jgi:hypothetical protein
VFLGNPGTQGLFYFNGRIQSDGVGALRRDTHFAGIYRRTVRIAGNPHVNRSEERIIKSELRGNASRETALRLGLPPGQAPRKRRGYLGHPFPRGRCPTDPCKRGRPLLDSQNHS